MKRILSTVIAIVMIVSVMTFVPFTANATGDGGHTLDSKNVGIDVPYFSGTTIFKRISGRNINARKTITEVGPINHADKDGDGELVLDGTISEEEWGLPIIDVDSRYAAERGTTTASEENTYFWWAKKNDDPGKCDNGTTEIENELGQKEVISNGEYVLRNGVSYKVWMAWDEDYLYIASEVNDPDTLFDTPDGTNIWNGDAIQFIIDPEGPNSVVGGEGYRADKNPRPWNYPEKARTNSNTGLLANIGAAYCADGNTGYPGIYDLAQRYNPTKVAHETEAGEVDYYSIDWYTYDVNYLNYIRGNVAAPNEIMGSDEDIYAFAAILPVNKGTNTDPNWVTTYELAVPWTLVSGSHYEYNEETDEMSFVSVDPDPKAGDEYGFSMVLLNGARGKSNYNSWLTWGSGICGGQTENSTDFTTAGGSNSLLLVSDELGTTGCDHEFAKPTCSEPYVCTKCGYEKGFAVGHDYTSEMISPLYADQDGLIRSTCSFCGKVVETTVPAVEKETKHLFDGTLKEGALDSDSEWYSSGWYTAFLDSDLNPIFENGKSKLAYSPYEGEMVFDYTDPAILGIKHYDGTYTDGKANYTMPNEQTYFETRNNYRSYSYKYDFRLGGFAVSEPSENYRDGIYSWFGGMIPNTSGGFSYGLSYAAGFFPTEIGATTGTFRIMEAAGQVMVESKSTQKILSESEVVDLGTDWHNVIFVFDESACAAFLYVDGECVCAAWDEGMGMNGNDQVAIIRRMDTPCMFKGMGIGSTTAFLEDADEPAGYTVTCDGEEIGTFDAGEVVTLPTLEFKVDDGKTLRFFTWEGAEVERGAYNKNNDTPNGRIYTLVMPAENVVLTSVFSYVSDVDGNGKVNSRDLVRLKQIIAGTVVPGDAENDRADIDGNNLVNSRDVSNLKKIFTESYTITK